jgi:signal transduction histidine kinase
MISEIDRLSRLVEDVLTFSRRGRVGDAGGENNTERETSAKKNPVSTVDLADIAEETISKLQPGLSMRGFDVGFERVCPLPVSGNGEALAQVAMNLLSNAEKYSGDAREITVVCRREGGRALMEVSDRGIGVEPRLAEKIFQEFFRCDDSLSSMRSGAGLGLTIARDIARRHGGDVLYDPREGGGSVFTLSLPIGGRLI